MQAKGIHFLVGYTDGVKKIEKANIAIQKVSFKDMNFLVIGTRP